MFSGNVDAPARGSGVYPACPDEGGDKGGADGSPPEADQRGGQKFIPTKEGLRRSEATGRVCPPVAHTCRPRALLPKSCGPEVKERARPARLRRIACCLLPVACCPLPVAPRATGTVTITEPREPSDINIEKPVRMGTVPELRPRQSSENYNESRGVDSGLSPEPFDCYHRC